MIKPRLNKITDKLIELTYLGIIFLMPLYFSFFPKMENVFSLGKMVLFRELVLLLLLFSIFSLFLKGKILNRVSFYLKNYGYFLVIPIIFLFTLFVITLVSSDFDKSLLGGYERRLGFFSYSYLVLFFVLLFFNLKKNDINKILFTISLSSFFVCLYGIIQFLGLDPFNWIESTSVRITSTQGQPNLLASYFLLVIPVVFYYSIIQKKIYWKIFFGLCFVLNLICLFFTQSRGGQLSFLIGLVFLLFIFIISFLKGKVNFKFNIKKIILFSFFVLLFFFFLTKLDIFQKERFLSSFDFNKGSVASRIDYWQASIDAFKKKPFLGYGLDSQKDIFARYYEEDWGIFNNVNAVPSRAHNVIFDWLLVGGLLGGFSYFILVVYFFGIGVANIKRNERDKLSFFIIFSFFCYLISLFFSFSSVTTEVYFWLYLAMLLVLYRNNLAFSSDSKETFFNFWFKWFIFVIFFSLIVICLVRESGILEGDVYYRQMRTSFVDREVFESYVLYGYIKDTGRIDNYYSLQFANFLSNEYVDFFEEVKRRPGKKILLELLDGLRGSGFYNSIARGQIYSALSEKKNDNYSVLAKREFENFGDSKMPDFHLKYSKIMQNNRDFKEAEEELEKALNCLPSLDDPRINFEHREKINLEMFLIYEAWGDLYFKQANFIKAGEYYNKAIDLSDNIEIVSKIVKNYIANNDEDGAVSFLSKKIAEDENNFYWNYLLADVYLKFNDMDNALIFIDKALFLAPENKILIKYKEYYFGG